MKVTNLVAGFVAAALLAAGSARADVPPYEDPVTPLPAECESMLGAWQSSVQSARFIRFTSWMFVSSDGIGWAVFGNYSDGKQFNLEARPAKPVTCTTAAGMITVSGDGNDGRATVYKQVDETTMTEDRMSSYQGSGPPQPDWKPEPYTVTWKRVAK